MCIGCVIFFLVGLVGGLGCVLWMNGIWDGYRLDVMVSCVV